MRLDFLLRAGLIFLGYIKAKLSLWDNFLETLPRLQFRNLNRMFEKILLRLFSNSLKTQRKTEKFCFSFYILQILNYYSSHFLTNFSVIFTEALQYKCREAALKKCKKYLSFTKSWKHFGNIYCLFWDRSGILFPFSMTFPTHHEQEHKAKLFWKSVTLYSSPNVNTSTQAK